ncbi:SMI1/KNR4 family protein [Yinghuangia seranimata]|uniref:SMI1/KNR4 family protein n=1 Tax=Yinghuangia seranimata TaxID=408067 RepID=UPI00248A9B76|nr:SMI1/KNR4 family protein [Yinghuangia seranimata]MDI2129132.1 hypothetical protein [Yinghuangia seranimata]
MSTRTQTSLEEPDEEPRRRERLPSPVQDETDDDVLLAKLAMRAWCPGQRFDREWLPSGWIAERYGPERMARWLGHAATRTAGGETDIELPALAEEVAAFFAGAARGPVFAPASAADVAAAEQLIGYALPDLLRRVYTEIGDGGFGPDSGLVSLRRGNRRPGDVTDWPSVHTDRAADHDYMPPASWLHLANGGCTMEWQLSLTAVDNPVLLYDADGWVSDWGETPHDGLRHAMPLRRWLSIWANDGQVWDDFLATC